MISSVTVSLFSSIVDEDSSINYDISTRWSLS